MKTFATALTALALTGCAIVPERVATTPLPQGTAVALGQTVRVGELSVTPVKVVEDSRCPINARCVWAGRLVVNTRIDGPGWRDSADIRLGEAYGTHGKVIALTSGEPGRVTTADVPSEKYRFVYEAGWNIATDPGPPPQ